MISNITQELWYSLFLTNPCKKCIVQACCSDKCELVISIDNFIYPHEKISEKKMWAWIFIISVLLGIISTIKLVYNLM